MTRSNSTFGIANLPNDEEPGKVWLGKYRSDNARITFVSTTAQDAAYRTVNAMRSDPVVEDTRWSKIGSHSYRVENGDDLDFGYYQESVVVERHEVYRPPRESDAFEDWP